MRPEYRVVGEVSLRAGPALSTPIFQTRSSNGLWLQSIGPAERIRQFLPISEDDSSRIGYVDVQSSRRIGEQAFYVFRDSKNSVRVDTQAKLAPHLRADYENLHHFPYFCRSVARFLNDKPLLAHAGKLIRDRRKNPFLSGQFSPDIDVADIYVERDLDRQIRASAEVGKSILLTGPRGIGKTFQLQMLRDFLGRRGNNVIYVNADASSSLSALLLDRVGISSRSARTSSPEDVRFARSQTVELISHLKTLGKAALILDDVDIKRPSSETVETLIQLVEAEVQVIAAASDLFVEQFKGAFLGLERYFVWFALTPPSVSEISQMLRNRLSHARIEGISADQIASLVSGLNFRQILSVLGSLSTDQLKNSSSNLGGGLDAAFDDYMRRALWASGQETVVDRDDVVRSILNAAVSRQPDLDHRSRDKQQRAAFQSTVDRLIHNGILVPGDNGNPRFAHRLIEDWWLKQRTSSAF